MAVEATKVVPLTCHGHSRPVTHLSFSSVVDDEQYYIISACKDNNPMLRDGVTGDWIGTFIGHKGAVWQARLSSDATLAATGSADFSAKVWDTHTGEALHTLQHSHIVRAVAFPNQPRPQILATGGHEKKLRIFDLSRTSTSSSPTNPSANSNAVTTPTYELGAGVHEGTIKSIVWCQDNNTIITAADDKKLRWWDLRAQTMITELAVDGPIGSCEFSHPSSAKPLNGAGAMNGGSPPVDTASAVGGGRGVLSVAAGKTAYFLDGSMPATVFEKVDIGEEVVSVAINPAERRFVTGSSSDTWVKVWDYDKKEVLGKFLPPKFDS
jgi:serine-threonine kinase receptor-associated protein